MAVWLLLVGAGRVDYGVISLVADLVRERFPATIHTLAPVWRESLPLTLFDFERAQYRAEAVNMYLAERYAPLLSPGRRLVVAIVEGDGYVEGLNFVFGLATPRLGVASVYTGRIKGERFLERLVKLVLHETGHLLGLGHCSDPRCVMRFSNSLAELDAKGDRFCPRCAARLRRIVGEG